MLGKREYTISSPLQYVFLAMLGFCACISWSARALAEDWTISVTLLAATSLSDDDASGQDDIYLRAFITPTLGSGTPVECNFFDFHVDNDNTITPNWTCVLPQVTGGPDTTVQITLRLMEHDTTSADDHFDINPDPSANDVVISFKPASLPPSRRL